MAPPQAATLYKKQSGTVVVSKDRKSLSWTPAEPPDAAPSLVISVPNIENLQQTPESAAKVMLKVLTKPPGQTEVVAHTFQFTAGSARIDCNTIKEALAKSIQDWKASQNAPTAGSGAQSVAMTIANALSGGKNGNIWEDDDRLKSDVKLQQSLMEEQPNIKKTFHEAMSQKPDKISATQFTSQFWASRVHLLRAHALSRVQDKAKTNVLIGLRRGEGGTAINLTGEMVKALWEQFPLVKRVYDELVPKHIKVENEFWSRYIQSRLHKTISGEKWSDERDPPDPILDRYLNAPEITGLRPTQAELHIPKFIDLEGNEENHSQRKGNKYDSELDPSRAKGNAIRMLNEMSEKLMAAVKPSDVNVSDPIGMSEADYESLRLRDLSGDPEQERIILNIRDQSRFFDSTSKKKGDANPFRNVDPSKAIEAVCADMTSNFPRPGQGAVPITPFAEQDLEDDDEPLETGSDQAMAHIMSLIQAHRDQTAEIPSTSGLSHAIYDRLTLTHATTIEFLRQFWNAFLSGDPSRVTEVASLVESLSRAVDRISVIADDAENERATVVRRAEQEAEDIYRKTGRRRRVDLAAIKGGKQVVNELMKPILSSLATATDKYRQALEQQTAEAADEVG